LSGFEGQSNTSTAVTASRGAEKGDAGWGPAVRAVEPDGVAGEVRVHVHIVAAQVEFESKVESGSSHFRYKRRNQARCLSTRRLPGVNLHLHCPTLKTPGSLVTSSLGRAQQILLATS